MPSNFDCILQAIEQYFISSLGDKSKDFPDQLKF